MRKIKHIGFCAGLEFQNTNPEFIRGLDYCVDNDSNKWGTTCMGVAIVSPDRLLGEDKENIFIYVYSFVHYKEISAQLDSMGFLEGKHYNIVDYGRFWSESSKIIFNAAFLTWFDPVDGDYYEFGTYTGRSLIEAYRVISEIDRFCDLRYGKNPELKQERGIPETRYFCFDSFEGLPQLSKSDTGGAFSEGDYKCDYETFMTNINAAGLDMERVSAVKSWYCDLNQDIISEHDMKKARIIHIDCDLYESTRDALAFCTDLVTDGTIIIFDDWFHFKGHPHRGEQRAFREWQEANSNLICTEYMREFPFRNSFIINAHLKAELAHRT